MESNSGMVVDNFCFKVMQIFAFSSILVSNLSAMSNRK